MGLPVSLVLFDLGELSEHKLPVSANLRRPNRRDGYRSEPLLNNPGIQRVCHCAPRDCWHQGNFDRHVLSTFEI